MMDEIYFRHGSTHFQHIFSGGYSAGYYSYIWSGVLDADAFEAFVETGDLFHQETAQRFRTEILERGGTRNAMEMYVNFRGQEPGIEPLLRQRGLLR
jgi:peptidyl-dipeptidase Dcp